MAAATHAFQFARTPHPKKSLVEMSSEERGVSRQILRPPLLYLGGMNTMLIDDYGGSETTYTRKLGVAQPPRETIELSQVRGCFDASTILLLAGAPPSFSHREISSALGLAP